MTAPIRSCRLCKQKMHPDLMQRFVWNQEEAKAQTQAKNGYGAYICKECLKKPVDHTKIITQILHSRQKKQKKV